MTFVWDPNVIKNQEAYLPYGGFLLPFQNFTKWPSIADLNELFLEHSISLRDQKLCISKRMRRRHRKTNDPKLRPYDQWITDEQVVPTRECNWHDFFNAMIWHRFPIAKQALYEAFRIERLRNPDPKSRTKEQDLLTLFDEGGCVELGATGETIVFGHAVFEQLATGVTPSRMFGIKIDTDLSEVDQRIANILKAGLLNLPKERLYCGSLKFT